MAWGRYESSFVKHPKVQTIPDAKRAGAIALHLNATLYCAEVLTDGFVPKAVLPRLAHEVGLKTHRAVVELLVTAGLFEQVPGGVVVHDYNDYNPTASEIKAKRKQTKDRVARHRAQQKLDVSGNAAGNALQPDDVTQPVTRYPLARADASAHARGRPVPSPEPSGVGEGEDRIETPPPSTPLEAASPAAPPPPELFALVEENHREPPPDDDLTEAELEEREQAQAAAQRRLATVQADDSDPDLPL